MKVMRGGGERWETVGAELFLHCRYGTGMNRCRCCPKIFFMEYKEEGREDGDFGNGGLGGFSGGLHKVEVKNEVKWGRADVARGGFLCWYWVSCQHIKNRCFSVVLFRGLGYALQKISDKLIKCTA